MTQLSYLSFVDQQHNTTRMVLDPPLSIEEQRRLSVLSLSRKSMSSKGTHLEEIEELVVL